jgi:hypothetical protein
MKPMVEEQLIGILLLELLSMKVKGGIIWEENHSSHEMRHFKSNHVV